MKTNLILNYFKRPATIPIVILLLAVLVRLSALFSLGGSIYFDFLLWDERIFHEMAIRLADGTYQSTSVYEFSPLPAYLIAGLYSVFSADPVYIRLFNLVLGVLTCCGIFAIGKNLYGFRAGWICMAVSAIYAPFILYSIVPLKTALSVLLFSLVIQVFLKAMDRDSGWNFILLGALSGLLINVRPNVLLILPLLPLLIYWNRAYRITQFRRVTKLVAGLLAGFLITVSPFIIRNYRVTGSPHLVTTQAGQNLYCGNYPGTREPYYRPLPFASSSPFLQGIQFSIEASRRVGEKLSHRESSDYWTRQVVKTAFDSPAEFAGKLLKKTVALFHRFEAGDHYDIAFIADYVSFFSLPWLDFGFLVPFGVTGILMLMVRSRKHFALATVFFIYGSTLVLFFTNARFRLPIVVLLIPFAVAGIMELMESFRTQRFRRSTLYVALFGAVLILSNVPLYGTDDTTAYYNTHAIILNSRGRTEEAVHYWQQSSKMKRPYSDYANMSLAEHFFQTNDIKQGSGYLNRISDSSISAAAKYDLLGRIYLKSNQAEKAIEAFKRSLEINSGQRAVRLRLIRLLEKIDTREAGRQRQKLEYIDSFYDLM